MAYKEALEAAGCEVIAYEEFGSYQGDWLAKVRKDGETFWLRDYYGSCSGCDAFEADVGWEPWGDDSAEEKAAYAAKVKAFGERMIEPQERLSYDEALAKVSANVGWDSDADEMVAWVKANRDV